ncbi:hypothetical protein [Azospirillum sp. TSO22-1]|uniref:hypothetical protein n=1 Tax=Azospirillum sp. TSO22-1 TaxID=716789 RepID=UPI000D6114A0|nr:hypothetical protein [Azospirillum sp. TSO22-1]PWC56046.1 hypothetical protein TSO221_03085 [Azospirillum sp. TSO22-1]
MARPAAWRMTAPWVVALGIGLTLAGPSQGADPAPAPTPAASPLADTVRHEVARQVPPSWRVDAVMLEPPESATGPLRVAARLKLAKPTYVVDGRDGPYAFVLPVAEAGAEKVLTGIATTAKARDGSLAVKLELQNPEVLDSLGKPAEELPGKVVVVGSEEAKAVRAKLDAEAKQRLADEQARRQREEELLTEQRAVAEAETERLAGERQAVEARAALIGEVRNRLLSGDRGTRVAVYEAVLGGNDPALRQFAVEAALQSRDPVLANLALKDWIARRKTIPVLLYATKEDPNSDTVLRNLGPLTIEVEGFAAVNGALQGKMGAPGYTIAAPAVAVGTLAQTELTVNTYGCSLTLRLTEHRTLDGLYRCQTLPTLVARVTLD